MQTNYVNVLGTKTAYLDRIPQNLKGIMLCIHGINRNKRDFDYFADFFVKIGFRVIALDIPGRSESEYLTNPADYNYEFYRGFLLEFIKILALENIILIGTSMGGILSILLAEIIPQKITAMIINDIGPYTSKTVLLIMAKYLTKYPEFENIKEAEEYLRIFFKPLNIKKEEHWQHMIRHSLKLQNDKYLLDFDPTIFSNFVNNLYSDRDLWNRWSNINKEIPILVLRGKDSHMLSEETLKKMASTRYNLNYIEYKNVGHVPSLLEEEQFEDIKTWISSVTKCSF